METFGNRLRAKRQEQKLSQEQLAEMMSKSGKTIVSAWETGKSEPSLGDLRKIAELLLTTSCYLVDGIEAGKAPITRVAPPGFIMVPAEEYIALQRRVIEKQDQQKQ